VAAFARVGDAFSLAGEVFLGDYRAGFDGPLPLRLAR
jgi:hypothetical protein